jgi:phosphoribosylaminoimidazolecarboxamide formyltransferase/IMP cyclohydrolase
MPRALLSVSDKTGLVDFGRGLAARGFELVSTGGTARALTDAGLPVTSVSDVTGFPEMMDGRVKTLHPKIHGGILARRDRPDDLASAAAHGIGLVDLVVVNLYPFEETAREPGVPFGELVEQIDIGGPSLVRAAAKNFAHVIVVVDPKRYPDVLEQLDHPGGSSIEFRFELARDAFKHTGAYDLAIWGTLLNYSRQDGAFVCAPERGARTATTLEVEKVRDLRYGENPHQFASLWEDPASPVGLTIVQGKELSYTNVLDLDAAWRIVSEFDEPAAAVIKHTNPCGAATGVSAADAYVRARDADALSAFGGIVGLNRPLDADTAAAITSTFVEAVIAPSVADDARPILATREKMRVALLAAPSTTVDWSAGRRPAGVDDWNPWWETEWRSVFGGLLLQERDRVAEARDVWPSGGFPKVVTKREPTPEEWEGLRFAWRICAHVKSNAVIFTGAQRTLAMGAGQMSRVDAVNVAVMKARAIQRSLNGSVAASDAFFPFRDGLDAVANAGATAIVQPGGSVRDAEVIAAADEHGVAMVFTGKRHFRH